MDAARYRELARAAFPDGFLAVRGVLTVAGWAYAGTDAQSRSWWVNPGHASLVYLPDLIATLIRDGDLLPDYADPLTRLAILIELATLCGGFSYPPAFVGDLLPIDLVPLCATDDGEIEAVFVALARLRAARTFPEQTPRPGPLPPMDYSPDEEISDHGLNG